MDLHSGEFCVDVSTFGDIVFENQGREACDTTFEKVCETKTEQVSPEHNILLNSLSLVCSDLRVYDTKRTPNI